jgi:seryl-tRNA synthetase
MDYLDFPPLFNELASSDYYLEEKKPVATSKVTTGKNEKKLVRRVANRDSARRSRAQKKEHLQQLEARVAKLQDEILKAQIEEASLAATNRSLKDEIAWYESLIPLLPAPTIKKESLQPQTPETVSESQEKRQFLIKIDKQGKAALLDSSSKDVVLFEKRIVII